MILLIVHIYASIYGKQSNNVMYNNTIYQAGAILLWIYF